MENCADFEHTQKRSLDCHINFKLEKETDKIDQEK